MKKSHLWIMILCCLIPIIGLAAIYLFNVPVGNVLFFGLILLCPVSHLLMMKYMGHNQSSDDHSQHDHHSASVSVAIEEKQR